MRNQIEKKEMRNTSFLYFKPNIAEDDNMSNQNVIAENGTALNSINENVAILNNAYDSFFAKLQKKVRVSNVVRLAQPNSIPNYVKYLNQRIEGFEKANARGRFKNANLLKANKDQSLWTVGFYLSKQAVEINGEPYFAEFTSFEDAIDCLKTYVELIENGHEQILTAVNDAMSRYIESYEKDTRIQRGHS